MNPEINPDLAKIEIEGIMDEMAVFNSHPNYHTPERVLTNIKAHLNAGNYPQLFS